jgi:hypothetical protein
MTKSEVVGRPCVVSDDLLQSIGQKNLWKTEFHIFRTFVWISSMFTHSSAREYHRLGYHRFAQDWFRKCSGCAYNPENGFILEDRPLQSYRQSVGLLRRVISPSESRNLHTGQHIEKLRYIFMCRVEFEPTISVFDQDISCLSVATVQQPKNIKKIKSYSLLTNWTLRYEDVWGNGCIDPRFLDLGTSWRLVVSFRPHMLYSRGKCPLYPLGGR